MNYRAAAQPLGIILWIVALSQIPSLIIAFFEPQAQFDTRLGFIISIVTTALLGGVLLLIGRGHQELHRKEGLFIVACGWLLAGFLGGLPFYVSGTIPVLLDAIFESISGFTTTGASILTNIEALPHSILLWRSETHWLGGMGIVVLFVAILPSLGIGGKHLYKIEATGPAVIGIHPRARDTARTLWLIYTGFSLAEFLLLWAGGMSIFDSVCHTFGTMATGGFSTKNASIGHFGTYFHVIITIFMFFCGVNFSLYYQALRRRWLFFKDAEFRFYVILLGGAIVLLLINVLSQGGITFLTALRDSAFTATAILTTTGFATADFEQYTPFAQGLLVALMFIGGSAGSTGGGMKVVRVLVMLRWAWKHVTMAFRPRAVIPLRVGGMPIDPDIEHQVVSFVLLFGLWFIAGIGVMLACGHDLVTSFTASVASVANIGPGLGLIGPTNNYALIHPLAKGFLALLMIIGRLEVLAITVLLAPGFWRRA